MKPEKCTRNFPPHLGSCKVNISNTGNLNLTFQISPSEANYTKVNETSFIVPKQSFHVFSIDYNTTDAPMKSYNSTYLINALESDAVPDNLTFKVYLIPMVRPTINLTLIPNFTEQSGFVDIYANVTDHSGTGISFVEARVTRPSGEKDSKNMTNIYLVGNISTWYVRYPDNWGNTTLKGNYTLQVLARTNVGGVSIANSSFYIYPKLVVVLNTLSSRYYQGDIGSIYYRVKDLAGEDMENVSVMLRIEDPLNRTIFNSSYKSDSEGMIEPLPQFSISSDAVLGNYTLSSFSSFFDEIASVTINDTSFSSFEVVERGVEGLFADIETAVVWYPNNIMRFGILVYDAQGRPVDPDYMNLTVYDPAENVYFTVLMSNMTREARGYYTYKYAMPLTTATGMYLAVLNLSKGSLVTQKLKAFRVASGGPYDLKLKLLEQEVYPGDYLDFEITIENKGEVSQDVLLEYWVSQNNQTWYYASESVYVAALSNKTLTRNAYIFSTQPLGIYRLNAKVTFDNVQPPVRANATFSVVEKPAAPPAPAPPAPPPAPPALPVPVARVEIIEYPTELGIESGWVKYPAIIVKNTGEKDLYDLVLLVEGIPLTWFNVTPSKVDVLPVNNTTTFTLRIRVPEVERAREYIVKLVAQTNETKDEKRFSLFVFTSRAELVRYEIEKVKKEFEILKLETETAKAQGKDVSDVEKLIDEIKEQISIAEEDLNQRKYDDAIAAVNTAWNLIEKARYLLAKAPFYKVIAVPTIPLWLIILIVILAVALVLLFLFFKRARGILERALRPHFEEIKGIKEAMVAEKRELEEERARIKRMLRLLDEELREGIISRKAYEELKARNEAKLAEIERKLRKL